MNYEIGDEVKFNPIVNFPITYKAKILDINEKDDFYKVKYIDCFSFEEVITVAFENEINGYWHEK